MNYILSAKTGIVTARNLANLLDIKAKLNPRINPPLIRWGNSSNIYIKDTKLNDPNLMRIASNKLSFSQFSEKNEIESIILYNGVVPKSYPIFVRTLLNSYSGKGIVIAEDENTYLKYRNYPYSLFKNFQFELRVHVLGGKVVKIFRKEKDNENDNEQKYPIRNIKNGYHFSVRNINNYPKVNAIAESLYKKFPLEMMGLDLGYVEEEHKYYIIEVNTCPSLNDETIKLYVDFLKEKLKE
jgi:glutathione synthase/RimK-type ligase-like ATP-grasp enzyme